jgi:hypothetical protein
MTDTPTHLDLRGRDLDDVTDSIFGHPVSDDSTDTNWWWKTDIVFDPAEHVANLIRRALEYIPVEQLVVTTDCGFGREGLSRRIAYYKCVALVEGTNIVRRELGLPEARVRAADPRLYFATGGGG